MARHRGWQFISFVHHQLYYIARSLMGNQPAPKWQEDYEFVQDIAASRIRVRHKTYTDNYYEIIPMAVSDEQTEELQQRISQRENDHNVYLQRIVRFCEKPERTACSNTRTYELVIRESTPTLADHCRYRRLKNRQFQPQEIQHVIRSVCLGLSYLKSINEKHGQIDLNNIMVNRQVYIKDPILVERQGGESLGFRKSVKGFPSPEKLREYYDCLISFDEYSSDLFSMGMVALQMTFLERDLRQVYTIKNPKYDNNHINFKLLSELVHSVQDYTLREWIRVLLHPEERYRKNVHEYFKGYKVTSSELRILKDNPLRIAPQEELVEPIQPYVQYEHAELTMNRPTLNGATNRSSSYILPVSHQTSLFARPSINESLQANSIIRQNRTTFEPNYQERSTRSISLPKASTYTYTPAIPNFKTTSIPQYSLSSYSLPKAPDALAVSKYESASLQDTKLNLSSLSQSFSKLSANLKSLIENQERQLKTKHIPITNLPPPTNRFPKKKPSLYAQLVVPIIPEVQQDPSNMTESEYVAEQYQIGTRYEGQKRNGKRNGIGKFYYSQGSYYDGEWKDNKMHGFGTLTYPNGSIAYRGQWRDDEFWGKGVLYNNDPTPIARTFDYTDMSQVDSVWIMYEGEMRGGKRHGTGKLTLMNGQYYEGGFVEGRVSGAGAFHSLGGSKISGVWGEAGLEAVESRS